jgi:hypothetical protein
MKKKSAQKLQKKYIDTTKYVSSLGCAVGPALVDVDCILGLGCSDFLQLKH